MAASRLSSSVKFASRGSVQSSSAAAVATAAVSVGTVAGRWNERTPTKRARAAAAASAGFQAGWKAQQRLEGRPVRGAGERAELVAEAAGRGGSGEFGVEVAALARGKFAGLFEEQELFELFRVHGRDSWSSR